MKHIRTYKLFESSAIAHEIPKYKVGVKFWLTSVQPNDDNFADNWSTYLHEITTQIVSNVFTPDEDQILNNLRSGQFEVDSDNWCDEVDAVMNKASISKIASKSQDVGNFIDQIQGEIYNATVDYYADLIGDEDEDEEDNDEDDEDEESGFMNLDALSDHTYGDDCQGVEYSSADPLVVISDDTISTIRSEIEGGDSLDYVINYVLDEDWIDEKDIPVLLAHLKDPTRLDAYIKEHQLDLDLLDGLPEVKMGVLQRTGIKDTSGIARQMRRGII